MDDSLTLQIACDGYTRVNIDELRDMQGNLKDLTEENYVRLRNSMTKFGFSFPVFMWIDPQDNTKWIVDAHQRLRTLRKMKQEGWTIPELPADLIHAKDRVEAKKKLLLLNSRYGQMTREGFDEFVDEVGFEIDDDIDDLLVLPEIELFGEDAKTDVIEDEAPEVSQEPAVSKLGEVYQLGRHRLMCGDATKIEDVEKLMNGQKADMVFTDPPYGVDYSSRVDEERRKGWGEIKNDDLKGKELQAFLQDSLSYFECPKYICCNWQSVIDFWAAYGKPNAFIVWDKGSIGLGAGYRNQHEIILFYGKLDTNAESNIWRLTRDATSVYTHPTQKPVELSARAIRNSTKANQLIVDIFGGSGGTIIAAEQTDRTCYMMEIDPKYCDVIRKRYAKFIGQEKKWQEVTLTANI